MRDGAPDEVVVENNALSSTQIDDFAARAKGCEARGDCKQIIKEMEDLSLKQQQEMIAVCATNPKACKETYGDISANGMLVREAIDRVLGADVPSQMKNDMSSLLAQQIEAEGVVTSTEFAQRLQTLHGIAPEKATLLADAALGAVTGGMGKGGNSAIVGKNKNTQIWTETKKFDSVPNAYNHWKKHGKEFPELQNAKQHVDATHSFVTSPPAGTLTKTRTNGDTLYYNPATNTFATKDAKGVPRTMFKPEKGMEYWNKQ